jgi:hypothetical protein
MKNNLESIAKKILLKKHDWINDVTVSEIDEYGTPYICYNIYVSSENKYGVPVGQYNFLKFVKYTSLELLESILFDLRVATSHVLPNFTTSNVTFRIIVE